MYPWRVVVHPCLGLGSNSAGKILKSLSPHSCTFDYSVLGKIPGSIVQDFVPARVISEGGMIQGLWLVSGVRTQKQCIWKWKSASVTSFETPAGTWRARPKKLCCMKRRTSFLTNSALECPPNPMDPAVSVYNNYCRSGAGVGKSQGKRSFPCSLLEKPSTYWGL